MLWVLLGALVVTSAQAKPVKPVKPKVESVDIRAFGDAAFIGGLGAFGTPPPGWAKAELSGVKALKSADVNFVNLEGSLARSCKSFEKKPFRFAVAPEALIQLGHWGVNLVGLANNHSLDCLSPAPGPESARALADVRKKLPGLAAHGVATDADALKTVALLTVRGVRLGMVAIKAWQGGATAPVGNLDNEAALLKALKKAKVDVRILSLHGGEEGARRPTATVMQTAREFVARYDGDIVFAHHPHAAQGFEVITKPNGRTAVIFYSLGNFLHNGLSPYGDGLAAKVSVTKAGVDARSLAAFPLAHPSSGPAAVTAAGLRTAVDTLTKSTAWIAKQPLPPGLVRVPVVLAPVSDPVPGFRLKVATPALAQGR